MKKKLLLLVLGLSLLLFVGGCNKKEETKEKEEVNVKDYVISDHIKLGQYKGIEVEPVEAGEVTEEDIEAAILEELDEAATVIEIKDRPVENGDTVNIDYEGLKDGVAFDGGTAKGADLEIGSGTFIPGFEEQLVGAKVGETVELDVTFPEGYSKAELAGQDVVFIVTVNYIKESVVPELNIDFVKENTDYETVEEFRESIRVRLADEKKEAARKTKMNAVLTSIMESSEVISYPQSMLDKIKDNMIAEYSTYASMYGMDLPEFIQSFFGMTMEQFETELNGISEEAATQQLVVEAIVDAEKITLTEQEWTDGLAKLAEQYNYETEEFLKNYGEEAIRETLVWEKVLDYVVSQSVEV